MTTQTILLLAFALLTAIVAVRFAGTALKILLVFVAAGTILWMISPSTAARVLTMLQEETRIESFTPDGTKIKDTVRQWVAPHVESLGVVELGKTAPSQELF